MSRVQLALRVSDLEGSIGFYSQLFGVEPAKRRPDYANFAITEPPLKLVLLEGEPGRVTVLDHLGVEVESTAEVDDATARLSELGLFTEVEADTTCCSARQDKVWVRGPGQEPWEVYTVREDTPTFGAARVAEAEPSRAAPLLPGNVLTTSGLNSSAARFNGASPVAARRSAPACWAGTTCPGWSRLDGCPWSCSATGWTSVHDRPATSSPPLGSRAAPVDSGQQARPTRSR